jgi:hypothetical protein
LGIRTRIKSWRRSGPSKSRVPPIFSTAVGKPQWSEETSARVGIRHEELTCADSAVLGLGQASHGVSVQRRGVDRNMGRGYSTTVLQYSQLLVLRCAYSTVVQIRSNGGRSTQRKQAQSNAVRIHRKKDRSLNLNRCHGRSQ